MDPDYAAELERIVQLIDQADVVTIFFPMLGKALIADLRNDPDDGPLVQFVPMARTIDERIDLIERQRPRLGAPEMVVAVPWFGHAGVLRRSGLLGAIQRRLGAIGAIGAIEASETAFEQLLAAESEHVRNLLLGRGYRTIWHRPRGA